MNIQLHLIISLIVTGNGQKHNKTEEKNLVTEPACVG